VKNSENARGEESKTLDTFHGNTRENKYPGVYTGSQVALQEKSAVPAKKVRRRTHAFVVHEHGCIRIAASSVSPSVHPNAAGFRPLSSSEIRKEGYKKADNGPNYQKQVDTKPFLN
jgi:hypothetical protein